MVAELTIVVLCPHCTTRVRVTPSHVYAPLEHRLVHCGGASGDGCARYFAVRIECEISYSVETARVVFGEEEERGPPEPPCG